MFIDAQKKRSSTFWAPGTKELEDLKVGHFVKVCDNEERFWIEITKINKDKLEGRVDNDLVYTHPFKCDDIVKFEKRHIYDITVIL